MRKRQQWLTGIAVIVFLATGGINARAQATFGVLHSFTNSTTDGSTPEGQPVLIGSMLYGVTYSGGSSSSGTLYQISTNGTGFGVLYSFTGGTNGGNPFCTLVSTGDSLYGMTFNGGVSDGGVVFGVNTNGTGYSVLHTFLGGDADGQYPLGSLTLNGSTLYGMTSGGGSNDDGVVFSISTAGSNFSVLHSFAGGTNDGAFPNEGVIVGGTSLYGTAYYGGSNNLGVVFAYNTALARNAYTILHHFAGGPNDGANPTGPLTLNGSALYGVTTAGGTNDLGVIFTVNTGGSGYAVLHSFGGGANDGASPLFGPLVVTNSVIYGATKDGGSSTEGVLFQMNTDGSGFGIVYGFSGGTNDGAYPAFGPLLIGSSLYGVTVNGGSNNLGVVYGNPAVAPCPGTNFLTQVSAIQIVSNTVVITVPTVACEMYQLQYTDEMVPINWINTGSPVLGTGSPIQFIQSIGPCSVDGVCLPPPSGLVSWWPGDGNALDIVGGNNGVLSNGATFAAGEVCQAFSFTNDLAAVVVGSATNLQLSAFTIETWFRRRSTSIITLDSCASAALFGFGLNGYGLFIELDGSGNDVLTLTQVGYGRILAGPPSIADTNWHHGAVTWSGQAAAFYLDGVAISNDGCSTGQSPCFSFTFNTQAAIGSLAVPITGACTFDGDIDEVSVYNRVLSAQEILNIYNAGAAGKCKPLLSQRFYRVGEFP
jgi:uncharacterized repeat protein (TIGR03803 family)